jgi:hypothetical protein
MTDTDNSVAEASLDLHVSSYQNCGTLVPISNVTTGHLLESINTHLDDQPWIDLNYNNPHEDFPVYA